MRSWRLPRWLPLPQRDEPQREAGRGWRAGVNQVDAHGFLKDSELEDETRTSASRLPTLWPTSWGPPPRVGRWATASSSPPGRGEPSPPVEGRTAGRDRLRRGWLASPSTSRSTSTRRTSSRSRTRPESGREPRRRSRPFELLQAQGRVQVRGRAAADALAYLVGSTSERGPPDDSHAPVGQGSPRHTLMDRQLAGGNFVEAGLPLHSTFSGLRTPRRGASPSGSGQASRSSPVLDDSLGNSVYTGGSSEEARQRHEVRPVPAEGVQRSRSPLGVRRRASPLRTTSTTSGAP